MSRQGEIYLVNFGKKYNSELGKVRPAVIIQNNFLNKFVQESAFKNVLVIPLTTRDIETEYKVPIQKRDKLLQDSYIITNWICALDLTHILTEKGVLTKLTENELQMLKKRIFALI